MADPFYEQYETNRGQESMTRLRFESESTLSYELIESDIKGWPGFLYHSLAQTFYGDADLWWIIHDANAIKRSSDWSVGDTIEIPKDYRDANVQTSNDADLLRRKLY